MAKIIHKKDPAGILPATVYQIENGENLLDWLSKNFTNQSDLCGELACSFFLNGKEIFRNDHDEIDESRLNFSVGENDSIVIINRPAGFDPISIAFVAVAIIAAAAAVYAFLNMPKLPGSQEGRKESPNNRLNAASNQFRPREGIPECFGYGVSYPDFIQPSFYYYENNVKKQVGLFCVGVGSYEITAKRIGETEVDSIPESSATVYGPGVNPPAEFLVIHEASSNVDGQELVAPNDSSLVTGNFLFSASQSGGEVVITVPSNVILDLNLSTSAYLYIRSTYDNAGTPVNAVNGVYPINSISYSGVNALIRITENYGGPPSVSGVVGRGYSEGVIGPGFSGELDYWIGWFDTPSNGAEEVWIHWQAPQGVRKSGGGAITIANRFQIKSLNTGAVFTKDVSITKNTLDPQFVTTRFSRSEFPGMDVAKYQVRAARLSGVIDSQGNASEQIKVESYVSVTPYSNPNFGDTTKLLVQRRATLFSPDQSGEKINVDYRRKLPYYNRSTGIYETSNLVATNSYADAAAYTLIVAGGETESTVALSELYGIYDGLSDSRLGGFTFTFDDADLSKGERIESICNVARVAPFHDGRQWRFSREEAKPVRAALFNRRSVSGNNAKQSWQPQRNDDGDSVKIIYVDPENNTEVYEERYFDSQTNSIISGMVGSVPVEIKLAGCRDSYQASNRADLEIRRLAYQRRSVNETAYRDAIEVELLDRVGWVDINDVDTFDGEIMGINGDIYDTSERFEPESGESYVVFLTDEEGYPSNTVTCTPRNDTEFGFIAAGLSGAYVAAGDQQIGSRYFIANASDLAASNFTIKSRTPNSDGTVDIELIEYRPEMFERDGALPPSEAPILNDNLVAIDVAQIGESSISTFTLKNNGEIDINGMAAIWYSGGVTPIIGDSFEVFAELISGSLTSGPVGSWVGIDINNVSWSISKSGAAGVDDCVLRLTIRQRDYTSNSVTNTIDIRSVIAAPLSLPASITEEVNAQINYGSASISILSNAEWMTESLGGNYTTITDGIGGYYEIKATNLNGNISGQDFDVWISLEDDVKWILGATSSESTTFDIEIREVGNPSNSASSSITLSVSIPA